MRTFFKVTRTSCTWDFESARECARFLDEDRKWSLGLSGGAVLLGIHLAQDTPCPLRLRLGKCDVQLYVSREVGPLMVISWLCEDLICLIEMHRR